ncbi:Peptidase A2 domain-containing protein [Mycena chlorophos]|uniref:Peptidase A2 domain-containing protein n=1 Tax=Mycena chlorophos TaxID=658473 RepID=A0A8H6VVV4_MYCCL|nr:Peptidase A2 domain-containing protein [Mycena chlorophos]
MVDAPDREGEIQDGIEAFLNAEKNYNRFPYRQKDSIPVMREPSPVAPAAPEIELTAAASAPTNTPSVPLVPHVHWAPDTAGPPTFHAPQTLYPGGGGPPGGGGNPGGDPGGHGGYPGYPGGGPGYPGGGPPGGGPPGGPPGGGGQAAAPDGNVGAPGYWQFNTKLPVTFLPEFEGDDDEIINYLGTMDRLARSSPYMFYQVGQLGPFRFNGEAKDWWIHLTEAERQLFSFHWGQLFGALQNHFITPHWRSRQVILFDAMRFRQPGHEKETPIQFFQRRISKNSFLNPVNAFNPADLALAVARVVYSQPAEWNSTINQTTCPTIAQLLDKAKTRPLP